MYQCPRFFFWRELLQVLFAKDQPAGRKSEPTGRISEPAGRENKPAGVKMNLQEKLDQGKHGFKNIGQKHQQTTRIQPTRSSTTVRSQPTTTAWISPTTTVISRPTTSTTAAWI